MTIKSQGVLFSTLALSTLVFCGCQPIDKVAESNDSVPASEFDLTHWKINIPTDANNDGRVDLVGVKDIQTYTHPDYFYLDEQGHMVFTAPNKAFTTPNSSNTRSELHQVVAGLQDKGDKYANNFALKANKRGEMYGQIGGNLQATLKVNHVAKRATYPNKEPAYSVVVGQIHATKDREFVAEGEGFGYGNEPLKIYFKKWPEHEYGSVFWNYERNLEKEDPDRRDISYSVWGTPWNESTDPKEKGIALDEAFSYEVNVYQNTMYLTFTTARHETKTFEINLANNVDAFGKVDPLDHPSGYAGDAQYFKAGAYDQCSVKDASGIWYPKCLGTGNWQTDKTNGDYVQVTFMRLVLGDAVQP